MSPSLDGGGERLDDRALLLGRRREARASRLDVPARARRQLARGLRRRADTSATAANG